MRRLFFVLSIILACLSTSWIEAKASQAQVAVQETALTKNRRLAEQGDAEAQFNLGMSYEFGVYVPKDFVQAYRWLDLAATQGDEKLQHNRDALEKQMTPEQIAKAQRLARQ